MSDNKHIDALGAKGPIALTADENIIEDTVCNNLCAMCEVTPEPTSRDSDDVEVSSVNHILLLKINLSSVAAHGTKVCVHSRPGGPDLLKHVDVVMHVCKVTDVLKRMTTIEVERSNFKMGPNKVNNLRTRHSL